MEATPVRWGVLGVASIATGRALPPLASATPPLMWPIPSAFLTGASAAAGIAGINALGNLSGFAGPFLMGYLKDATGNFTAGLLVLGGCALVGSIVALTLKVNPHLEVAGAAPGEPAPAS